MNYYPSDYQSILDISNKINEDKSALDIDFVYEHAFDEGAETAVKSIQKTVESSIKELSNGIDNLNTNIEDMILNDLCKNQENYIELVKIGYETNRFPFEEWFSCIKEKTWLFNNITNIINHFKDMVGSNEVNIMLVDNVNHFYNIAVKLFPSKMPEIFNGCIKALDELPEEMRRDFIEHFVYDDNIISYIYTYPNVVQNYYPKLSNKVGLYLNYLFIKTKENDLTIEKTMEFISQNKDEKIIEEITDILTKQGTFIGYNHLNVTWINEIKYKDFIEYDKQYNVGLSPIIAKKLYNLQEKLSLNNTVKEKIHTVASYLDKNYQYHILDMLLPVDKSKINIKKKI